MRSPKFVVPVCELSPKCRALSEPPFFTQQPCLDVQPKTLRGRTGTHKGNAFNQEVKRTAGFFLEKKPLGLSFKLPRILLPSRHRGLVLPTFPKTCFASFRRDKETNISVISAFG